MSQSSPTPLQKYLELYLVQEGLHSIIPDYRRKSMFAFPVGKFGVSLLMFAEISCLSLFRQRIEWFSSILIAIGSLMVSLVLVVVYMLYKYLKTRNMNDKKTLGTIGMIMVVSLSLSLMIANGYYLNSLLASFAFIPWAFMWLTIFAVVNQFHHRIQTLLSGLRSVIGNITRSIQLIIVILPLMLVLILFSAFSGELWQAIGVLSLYRLIVGISMLFSPAMILLITNLSKLSKDMMISSKDRLFCADAVYSLDEIKKPLSKGVISLEEWRDAVNQLSWMHKDKILEESMFIERRVRNSFALLLVFTVIFVLLAFSMYFFILFRILITPEQIANWTGIQIRAITMPVVNFIGNYTINILSTDLALFRVSIFLAAFVSTTTLVQSLTDETFRNIFTEHLNLRLIRWISSIGLYKAASTPGCQIWSVIRDQKTPRVVHIVIVTPKMSTDNAVRKSCELVGGYINLQTYDVLRITAYEQKDLDTNYVIGMSGRKWIYVHNSINDVTDFYENHTDIEDLSTDHFLGDKCVKVGLDIPDRWYSEQENGAIIGRNLWNNDIKRSIILHPRINVRRNKIVAHIHIRHKLEKSQEYKELIAKIFNVVDQSGIEFSTLMLSIMFRETLDRLAILEFDETGVVYKDDISNRYERFSCNEWRENNYNTMFAHQ